MSDDARKDRAAELMRMALDVLDGMTAELTFPPLKINNVVVDGQKRAIELDPESGRAVAKATLRFLRSNIDKTGRG